MKMILDSLLCHFFGHKSERALGGNQLLCGRCGDVYLP